MTGNSHQQQNPLILMYLTVFPPLESIKMTQAHWNTETIEIHNEKYGE